MFVFYSQFPFKKTAQNHNYENLKIKLYFCSEKTKNQCLHFYP
jgi:hypothetical protein